METIVLALEPHINWIYGAIIIGKAELIKKISVRQDCKRYVLKMNYAKIFEGYPIIKFNIRCAVAFISFMIGLGIYMFGDNIDAFELFATFCIANVVYDYAIKLIKNKILEKQNIGEKNDRT